MRTQILLIALLFVFSNLTAQEVEQKFELKKEIKKEARFITTDQLGNLYLVNDYDIWMYNKDGDSLRAFNSRRFGEITFVDPTDPYKILVYFRNYHLILILDNYLSLNGEQIDLQTQGFDQSQMACRSRVNGFWVFDGIRQKVYHLNSNFEQTHETVNLLQWNGKRIFPNYMLEYNNKLFVNDPSNGLLIFDHFGTYIKKIPIKGIEYLQTKDGIVNYLSDNQLCSYNINDLDQNCALLQGDSLIDARLEKEKLYVLDQSGVQIFEMK